MPVSAAIRERKTLKSKRLCGGRRCRCGVMASTVDPPPKGPFKDKTTKIKPNAWYICVLILLYVSGYCYVCVRILLFMNESKDTLKEKTKLPNGLHSAKRVEPRLLTKPLGHCWHVLPSQEMCW